MSKLTLAVLTLAPLLAVLVVRAYVQEQRAYREDAQDELDLYRLRGGRAR